MRALFTSIALATLAIAAPAAAQPGLENYSVSIGYSDIDTANPEGVSALIHRVKARADRFCVAVGDSPLQQALQAQQCRHGFVQAAERNLQLAETPATSMRIVAR